MLSTTEFSIKKILKSVHTAHLCVTSGPPNKQRVFPYIRTTDWFL
jgi:hypothetical protein